MITNRFRTSLAAIALAISAASPMVHADPIVKDGDVVAIIGDSITEQRQYGTLIEDYLLMCQPAKLRTMQFGWSGETVGGLNNRMADFLAMKPTVATLCYGMNDGRYVPVTNEIKSVYHEGLEKAVRALQAGGAKIVVGSPGCVDADAFVRPTVSSADYNVNLGALKDEAAAVAKATNSSFADVYSPMIKAMALGKAKFGQKYSVAGSDGVHPKYNGGLAMAYAFLKGLGFDGEIGSIRIDLTNHTALTTGRHDICKLDGSSLTIVSRAYPFCFTGDPKEESGTVGMTEFIPFNADLNRFMLTAVGPAPKYRVTWGKESKEFTAEQLKAGINLAAEFQNNPFSESFAAVHQKVVDKQGTEILLLKQLLHSLKRAHEFMADHDKELDSVTNAIPEAQAKLADEATKLVVPVTHTITLEAIQ